ncbi:MAG TPA: protein kinase [Thermoanaerobaculaceae bacterium]|nr:protein kinase [Thermoanaerobaculaceae bacterium]HRS17606.1 protein kinase [Thermoanaerobaculaceae bacterium]
MDVKQLGRYEIERVLGRGAMGVVYLARDPVIGRQVALKTLALPSEADEAEEFRQRFLREAQAAGRLSHPVIVTVFDAGVDGATGLSYMAMEFIEGRSLRDLLRAGQRFAYSEVARIGTALAGGLDYAHSKGVVHRDIKPANILLTPQGLVKITDFGVARLESSNLTATGQFIGTPNYMSPEQVMGRSVDGRSDLFSLGVVLFEMLTGSRPFVAQSLTEVTYKIVHEAAPIPSRVRPGLPPAFNPIILKLLEKDPERRYGRGNDVARALDALRRVLAGLPGDSPVSVTVPAAGPSSAGAPPASVVAAPTATRATELATPPQAPPSSEQTPAAAGTAAATPSVWRQAIETRWVVTLLALVVGVPALVIAALATRIERGPWPATPPGEAERRHRAVIGLWEASAALQAGQPQQALEALEKVWAEAPYSQAGRRLKQEAEARALVERDVSTRLARAQALREEGWALHGRGRLAEALDRLQEAVALDPSDPLASGYLEIVREKLRSARPPSRTEAPAPAAVATPVPEAPRGEARLEVYFNCPLSAATLEIDVDGEALARKQLNFYTKGFLGLKKKGAGVYQEVFTVRAGSRTLTARLRNEEGTLLAEQVLEVVLPAAGRAVLKVEMEGEQAVPRFSLAGGRAR